MDHKPPAFQFYAKEWLSSTATLTLAAQGGYMRLLAWSWDNGPLPKSDHERARLLSVTVAVAKRLWSEFSLKWKETSVGFINVKLEEKRSELHAYKQRRQSAGKVGAERRWQSHANANGDATPEPIANPMRFDSSSSSSASAIAEDQGHTPRGRATPHPPSHQNPHGKPTNLVNGPELRRHGMHAWCDFERGLCVPFGLDAEFRQRGLKPKNEILAWYAATVGRLRGVPIGDDLFAFWRHEFAAWIGTVTAKPTSTRSGDSMDAAKRSLRRELDRIAAEEGDAREPIARLKG